MQKERFLKDTRFLKIWWKYEAGRDCTAPAAVHILLSTTESVRAGVEVPGHQTSFSCDRRLAEAWLSDSGARRTA